jgi:hypothetical protein
MCRRAHFLLSAQATAMLTFALSAPAEAVAILGSNDSANLVAPGNDPGWDNVARLASASAVYLGDRWMITANHVSEPPTVAFPDGRVFNTVPGSDVTLTNPASLAIGGSPDLRMFRLAADPGLPALQIASSTPTSGTLVTMIGNGLDKAPAEIGWQVTGTNPALTWNSGPLPTDNIKGFATLSTAHMQWGQARVSGSAQINNNTVVFSTPFSSGSVFSAQAVPGDSGGGVFQSVGGAWQLVGIMDAQQLLSNQPSNTIVFGDQTYSSDLAIYRDQIMNLINKPDPVWQNQSNYFDVDHTGTVTPFDLLLIINDLEKNGTHSVAATRGAGDPSLDVDGDGTVSVFDALTVLDDLLGVSGSATASVAPGVNLVPEPPGSSLALAGGLALVVARLLASARRRRRIS